MLVGVRACEHFGFHRVPTIHYFPAPLEPVRIVESFSLTAAGQPRILTGFPSCSRRKLREPALTAAYITRGTLSIEWRLSATFRWKMMAVNNESPVTALGGLGEKSTDEAVDAF